jgi:uncharacterized protein YdeI (YjbR/CyaY-like superfamily)
MNVIHFETPEDLHRWFRRYGARKDELWIGFFRKELKLPGVSYAEALDEALCWGWIDGVRKKVDATSYTNRFTPRRTGSVWSLVNVQHIERLTAAGRMQAAGRSAFEARRPDRTGIYSFEKDEVEFAPEWLQRFQQDKNAWHAFLAQPPGYKRVAKHWVMSAKRLETQERRLQALIEASRQGVRLEQLVGKSKAPPKKERE